MTDFGVLVQKLLPHLRRVKGPDVNGNYRALCPFHEDRDPSLSIHPEKGWRCFAGCGQGNVKELVQRLGLRTDESQPGYEKEGDTGLSVAELAAAKGLPQELLRCFGVADGIVGSGRARRPCVDIPYVNEAGEVVAVQKRLSLQGSPRFIWRRGDHPILYGLDRLAEIRKVGRVVVVEGATDVWTLSHHGIPALGLPGASTWQERYATMLSGFTVYVWHESDEGGDSLVRSVTSDLPEARVIEPPPGVKDPSELYQRDPQGFRATIDFLMRAARPASELKAEAFSKEARQCLNMALPLLADADLFRVLENTLYIMGYAGDARPAILAFIALTSRLTNQPLKTAYISQGSAGKNAAFEAALPFLPQDAYYLVRASSPRALIFNDQSFSHRTVIMSEADSLPEEGPAASAMRSLMSDDMMTYEVVEKGEDGRFHTRRISKPGPTGLITTSVKALGEQASTRMLTVPISDSTQQTRKVLHAQADKANEAIYKPDLSQWLALQRWLELAGEKRVVIPYAHALADAVPADAVRMRRDFAQLLTVIKTIAIVHQRQREQDNQGRIIASLDDYAIARWLLEEIFAATVTEGVTPAVKETVQAVARLSQDGTPVTEQQLVKELKLAKSTVHYRVKQALSSGFLVNKTTQKGAPAQLVLGAPLPEVNPLPEVSAIVCVDTSENGSNPRTTPQQAVNDATDAVRSRFEDGSNPLARFNPGSNAPSNPSSASLSRSQLGFERFEGFSGAFTHTDPQAPAAQLEQIKGLVEDLDNAYRRARHEGSEQVSEQIARLEGELQAMGASILVPLGKMSDPKPPIEEVDVCQDLTELASRPGLVAVVEPGHLPRNGEVVGVLRSGCLLNELVVRDAQVVVYISPEHGVV